MPLFDDYSLSFSHAIVRVNGHQYTAIRNVAISQSLTEGVVYGTDSRPLKRTVGQLSMGAGKLVFSDIEEGIDFWQSLSPAPLQTLFNLTYTLNREGLIPLTKTVECISCRLLSFEMEHEAGPDALGITYPFSFMSARIDGSDLTLSPQSLINLVTGEARKLGNALL